VSSPTANSRVHAVRTVSARYLLITTLIVFLLCGLALPALPRCPGRSGPGKEITLTEEKQAPGGPEPPRRAQAVAQAWQMVSPVLDGIAWIAACRQDEGPAVVAKALVVLGQSAVAWLSARRDR
jgi:hypothetical protein